MTLQEIIEVRLMHIWAVFIKKKRVSLEDKGKRGDSRTIIAANLQDKWIFLYGYPKNKKDNIDDTELRVYRTLAERLVIQDIETLSTFLEEVFYENDTQK